MANTEMITPEIANLIQGFFTKKFKQRFPNACLIFDPVAEELENLPIDKLSEIMQTIDQLYQQYGNQILSYTAVKYGTQLNHEQLAMHRIHAAFRSWIAKNGISLNQALKQTNWPKPLISYFQKR
jgi:hypothetical protein